MYQALYRKYRPKSFADVYGQDHVVTTLKNEIKENRVSHAYLFTGSRGTGKTTCAKIFAKAVNCENPKDGNPCNECEVCRGLDSGAIYDVVEIDAASNNGVDNIRELREEANYTPSRGRYRVYIIDEVHMLSAGAFNALLKTLEEPPAYVIFILATTEVHKLPATILSRCQRFDFKRIKPETMAVRLKEVAGLENMTLDDDAALLIARIADGALRDGLSILDQCAGRSSIIDSALVSQVAGLAGSGDLHRLAECICAKNSGNAIDILSELYQNSYDMERLCTELISYFRNCLIIKTVKKSRELIICTEDEFNAIAKSAGAFSQESIIFILDLFQDTLARIKSGVNSRIEMEMAFIKLCEPRLEQSADAMLERISRLEAMLGREQRQQTPSLQTPREPAEIDEGQHNSTPEEPLTENGEITDDPVGSERSEPQPSDGEEYSNEEPESSASQQNGEQSPLPVDDFDMWAELMDIIHKNDIALFGVLSGAQGSIVGEHFVIDSPNPTIKEFIKIPTHSKAIRQAVYELTGRNLKLAIAKKKAAASPQRDLLEDLISKAQNNIEIKFE